MRLSVYNSHLRGILVSGNCVWDLHERVRIQLCLSDGDETFSINCTAEIPEDVDRGWFYFFVTLFDQFYWVSGATIGGLLGNLVSFDTEGLDFVMTALFVVIFLEQWMKDERHASEWVGLGAGVVCLILFGADNFLIPTMVCILVLLTALRGTMEKDTDRGISQKGV